LTGIVDTVKLNWFGAYLKTSPEATTSYWWPSQGKRQPASGQVQDLANSGGYVYMNGTLYLSNYASGNTMSCFRWYYGGDSKNTSVLSHDNDRLWPEYTITASSFGQGSPVRCVAE
jgi:hypothetical protein